MAAGIELADHGRMPRQGREFWARLVAELERSGDRHREFAARRNFRLAALRYWLYRLRRERDQPARRDDRPRILPVRVIASTAPTARRSSGDASSVEVELPSGVRLRFPTGTDGEYVATMIKRLG